jgi:hypothetical protein
VITVAFPNEGDFGSWHDARCRELGVPFPGYDHEGNPAILDQWTTAVADPWTIDGYTCITVSEDEYANDPTLKGYEVVTVKYPSEPGSPVDANGDPISSITAPGFEWSRRSRRNGRTSSGITYDTAIGEPV